MKLFDLLKVLYLPAGDCQITIFFKDVSAEAMSDSFSGYRCSDIPEKYYDFSVNACIATGHYKYLIELV